MRTYIDGVLRFGIPPKFYVAIMKPNKGSDQKIFDKMTSLFGEEHLKESQLASGNDLRAYKLKKVYKYMSNLEDMKRLKFKKQPFKSPKNKNNINYDDENVVKNMKSAAKRDLEAYQAEHQKSYEQSTLYDMTELAVIKL